MNLTLFLNAAEPDPRLALVVSQTDLTRRPMPVLTRGDRINLRIVLVTSAGAIAADSGGDGLSCALALGVAGHSPILRATDLVADAAAPKGWTGVLSLDSDELTMYVRSALRPALVLSFFTFSTVDGRTARCALDCPVADAVDLDAVDLPVSLPSTMPSTFQPAFVELDSGPARLQLLNASAADVGKILQGTVNSELKSYQVRVGTDDEDLPAIVHPANYDAVTNAVVFVQL